MEHWGCIVNKRKSTRWSLNNLVSVRLPGWTTFQVISFHAQPRLEHSKFGMLRNPSRKKWSRFQDMEFWRWSSRTKRTFYFNLRMDPLLTTTWRLGRFWIRPRSLTLNRYNSAEFLSFTRHWWDLSRMMARLGYGIYIQINLERSSRIERPYPREIKCLNVSVGTTLVKWRRVMRTPAETWSWLVLTQEKSS